MFLLPIISAAYEKVIDRPILRHKERPLILGESPPEGQKRGIGVGVTVSTGVYVGVGFAHAPLPVGGVPTGVVGVVGVGVGIVIGVTHPCKA